jgi:hypothetical protein
MANKQRGVSLEGFLVVVVVLVLVSVTAMKIVPAYIQDKTIKSKLEEVANDPDLKNAPVHEIRAAFSKRATVSDITAIKAEDIEVAKDANGMILSARYSVKIPLLGNAALLLEFNPSSASK